MKAVAFNILPFEKELLAKANHKKHEITLISNVLNMDTCIYAEGKDAVIVSSADVVSDGVIERLAALGIKYIITRSIYTGHIDKAAISSNGIKLANVPNYSVLPEQLINNANELIRTLDKWQLNKCAGKACVCAKDCAAANVPK